MITDKLGSYAAARRQILPAIEHRSHKGLNNRAENSHLPCDGESGRCKAFDPREAYNGSSPSSPPSATCSSRPVPIVPLSPRIFIVWTPWRNGKPSPMSQPNPGQPNSLRSAAVG
jgi:putative transposase